MNILSSFPKFLSLSRFRCSLRCFRSVDVGAVAADDAAALLESYGLRLCLNLVVPVGVSFLFPATYSKLNCSRCPFHDCSPLWETRMLRIT